MYVCVLKLLHKVTVSYNAQSRVGDIVTKHIAIIANFTLEYFIRVDGVWNHSTCVP